MDPAGVINKIRQKDRHHQEPRHHTGLRSTSPTGTGLCNPRLLRILTCISETILP
jgi:hypothetical protein